MYGRVTALTPLPLGDELAADVLTGADEIVVDDIADFDEDGGWLRIGGTDGEVVQYLSADDDTGTIVLATPLAANYDEGERVDVWDAVLGEVPVDYEADLVLDDDVTGDPLQASVDHALVPLLRAKVRPGKSEAVSLEWDGDDLRVVNVLGKEAQVAADYIVASYMDVAVGASGQSIPNNTWTTITDWFDVGSVGITRNLGKLTVPVDGVYDCRVGVTFANGSGNRQVRIRKWGFDGSDLDAGRAIRIEAPGTGVATLETAQYQRLLAGQAVSFEVLQTSGGALDLQGANVFTDPSKTDATVRYVGPL